MKTNQDGAKWNAPSHSGPTEAWLATKGWVPAALQKPAPPKKLTPTTATKPARRGRR